MSEPTQAQQPQQTAYQPQAASQSTPMSDAARQSLADMMGQMSALQKSGLFLTPYQRAMKAHPIGMGIANAMQAFGQGVTHQPFYTENQQNQTALQQQQAGSIATLSSPANMMNLMMMRNMLNPTLPGTSTANTGTNQTAPAPATDPALFAEIKRRGLIK